MSESVFSRMEQQLTALQASLPASLLLTGASIAVMALGFHISKSRSKASGNSPTTLKGDKAVDGTPRGVPDLLIAPEQLARVIKQRRSIFPKDYNGAIVSDKDLQMMLEAANWAPNHGNTEPWRFVVMGKESTQEMLELSIQLAKQNLNPEEWTKREIKVNIMRNKKLPQVSHVIAMCMRCAPNRQGKLMPEWEEISACASAAQNMQLMATSLGVACMWSSWWPEARDAPEFKAYLGLEPEDRCLGVLMTGRTDRAEGYRSTRGPIEEKVQWRP